MSAGDSGEYASSPCGMHEADPAYVGLEDVGTPADLKRWRTAERERLIAARREIPPETRAELDRRIIDRLRAAIGALSGLTVSAYWPFRAEPDLRPFLKEIAAAGGRCALPVVVERAAPLDFRAWAPGDRLARGVWNIPVPEETAESVIPDLLIAPVVGFDPACYRLGYGGGFFDRTLAAHPGTPRVLGVGYEVAALPTIHPQWHDVPLDSVVTEACTWRPAVE